VSNHLERRATNRIELLEAAGEMYRISKYWSIAHAARDL